MLSKASSSYTRLQSQFLVNSARRCFGTPTQELLDNLKAVGIRNKNVVHNPT